MVWQPAEGGETISAEAAGYAGAEPDEVEVEAGEAADGTAEAAVEETAADAITDIASADDAVAGEPAEEGSTVES